MSQPECPVCMVAFDRDSRNTVTTECGHQFHYTCLFKWNQDNSNCPMCRHDFEDIEKAPEPPSGGQQLQELSMTGDFIESAREFGMRINCQECNEKVEECSTGCGRITCYCQGPQISQFITNRSPIQQQNTELPTCIECWRNRYHTVHDYLDQRMTRDLLTDEIYDTEQMEDYYEMFFNNTNGNYIDENGEITLENSTFTDYDDFLDHIRDSYTRHIGMAENFDEILEEVLPELHPINDDRERGIDIDNLFSAFDGLDSSNSHNEVEADTDSEVDTEVDEPVEIEHFELNVQPLCGPDGEIYIVDKEHMIYNMNGEVVGEHSLVNGEYQIVMNN